jgi:hypothetical protein
MANHRAKVKWFLPGRDIGEAQPATSCEFMACAFDQHRLLRFEDAASV